MPMNGENVYVVNHIFPSELNGNTGYKFYYNPGNGDIYNNWRYAFIRREYEHKNKRCDSNGDYVIYLQSGKYC